jgi:hypothetical protein
MKTSECFRVVLAAAVLVAGLSGCRAWNLYEDEPFSPEIQEMTAGVRPAESTSRTWFTSAKGKQVDSNFGIGRGK